MNSCHLYIPIFFWVFTGHILAINLILTSYFNHMTEQGSCFSMKTIFIAGMRVFSFLTDFRFFGLPRIIFMIDKNAPKCFKWDFLFQNFPGGTPLPMFSVIFITIHSHACYRYRAFHCEFRQLCDHLIFVVSILILGRCHLHIQLSTADIISIYSYYHSNDWNTIGKE